MDLLPSGQILIGQVNETHFAAEHAVIVGFEAHMRAALGTAEKAV